LLLHRENGDFSILMKDILNLFCSIALGIDMNNLHSAGDSILLATTGGPSVTCDVAASTPSAANTVLLDVAVRSKYRAA
jgi:hypothetical protein